MSRSGSATGPSLGLFTVVPHAFASVHARVNMPSPPFIHGVHVHDSVQPPPVLELLLPGPEPPLPPLPHRPCWQVSPVVVPGPPPLLLQATRRIHTAKRRILMSTSGQDRGYRPGSLRRKRGIGAPCERTVIGSRADETSCDQARG